MAFDIFIVVLYQCIGVEIRGECVHLGRAALPPAVGEFCTISSSSVCFPDGSLPSESAVLLCWGKHTGVGGADWRSLKAPGWLVSWVVEVVSPSL